jgi:Holliday junction resolvasome RuvABC endonuclease subunit
MKVLGLDLATITTGFCIIENGNIISRGTLEVNKDDSLENRIMTMKKLVKDLALKYDVNYLIWEKEQGYVQANRLNTAFALCKMQGCLMSLADDLQLSNIQIPINRWRTDVGIKHNQKRPILKQKAIEKVNELFGIITESDDEAEAILITTWFINNYDKLINL